MSLTERLALKGTRQPPTPSTTSRSPSAASALKALAMGESSISIPASPAAMCGAMGGAKT